jgi:hypothetical protein
MILSKKTANQLELPHRIEPQDKETTYISQTSTGNVSIPFAIDFSPFHPTLTGALAFFVFALPFPPFLPFPFAKLFVTVDPPPAVLAFFHLFLRLGPRVLVEVGGGVSLLEVRVGLEGCGSFGSFEKEDEAEGVNSDMAKEARRRWSRGSERQG